MPDPIEGFEIRDLDGTLFTLTAEEAPRFLAILNESDKDEPLSDGLRALRARDVSGPPLLLLAWTNPPQNNNEGEPT